MRAVNKPTILILRYEALPQLPARVKLGLLRLSSATEEELIPTVVDPDHYPLHQHEVSPNPLVVGWIGSPSTAQHLDHVIPALEVVAQDQPLEVLLVGAVWPRSAGQAGRVVVGVGDGDDPELRRRNHPHTRQSPMLGSWLWTTEPVSAASDALRTTSQFAKA